jgi:thymidylate synthase
MELLNIVNIDAENLPEAWYLLQQKLWDIDAYEYRVEHGSYPGMLRREFDFVVCRIRRPHIRPLCDIIPHHMSFPPPTTAAKIEEYFNSYILNPLVPENTFYTYGERIVPQVLEVIRRFQIWGFGHAKASVTIAKPEDITALRTPDDPESRASEPCLREITFKMRKDREDNIWRLHMVIYFRVWDLFGGFPENLGGLQLLNEWVVENIGPHPKTGEPLETGEMIVMSPSLNVREHIFNYSKERVGKI